MATQVKHRRGTNAEILAGTPAIAELWFNTTDNSIHMGDGVTPGGVKHVNIKVATLTFDSVADMKSGSKINLSSVNENTKVNVTGYYEPQDSGAFTGVVKKGTPPGPDDGGSIHVIDGNTYVEVDLNGKSVNVAKFGATGDRNTDASRIQKCIDYMESLYGTASSENPQDGTPAIKVPPKRFSINQPMFANYHGFRMVCKGEAVFRATTFLTNTQFILSVGDSGETNYSSVEGIAFERINSNPFRPDYNGATFGGGATYNFINSCNGLYIENAHRNSYSKRCRFIGLRCGKMMKGAYLHDSIDDVYEYNDRHIYGRNNDANTISNNSNVFKHCVFGASVMTGGVYLEEFDNLQISDTCSYENAHQTPWVFRACRGVYVSNVTMEANNKFWNDPSAPSYISDSTSFMPLAIPDISVAEGFSWCLSTCAQVEFDEIADSNGPTPRRGAMLNDFCFLPPLIKNYRVGNDAPQEAMFQQSGSTNTGFIFENPVSEYLHKLVEPGTPCIVYANRTGESSPVSIPSTWWFSPTGNDNIKLSEMSELNPLKTMNLRCIPQGAPVSYSVNIRGQFPNTEGLFLPSSTSATIRVDGLDKTTESIGAVRFMADSKVTLSDLRINGTIEGLNNLSDSSVTRSVDLSIEDCLVDVNSNEGIFRFLNGIVKVSGDSEFSNSNAIDYTARVGDGMQMWIEQLTTNKRISVDSFGSLAYASANYTGPVPTKEAGVLAIIDTL